MQTQSMAAWILYATAALGLSFAANAQEPRPAPAGLVPAFDVATIKPSKNHDHWRLQPTPNGYTATNRSLRDLLEEAYAIYDNDRFSGGPAWISSQTFDLEAKIDPVAVPNYRDLPLEERHAMLLKLLKERFHLSIHDEMKSFPVYALIVSKHGLLVKPTPTNDATQDAIPGGIKGICNIDVGRPGVLQGHNCDMHNFTDLLRGSVDRVIVDRTNLPGRYTFALHWDQGDKAETSTEPSIFTAVREQLGLELVPAKAPVQVIVVDHAKQPVEN